MHQLKNGEKCVILWLFSIVFVCTIHNFCSKPSNSLAIENYLLYSIMLYIAEHKSHRTPYLQSSFSLRNEVFPPTIFLLRRKHLSISLCQSGFLGGIQRTPTLPLSSPFQQAPFLFDHQNHFLWIDQFVYIPRTHAHMLHSFRSWCVCEGFIHNCEPIRNNEHATVSNVAHLRSSLLKPF